MSSAGQGNYGMVIIPIIASLVSGTFSAVSNKAMYSVYYVDTNPDCPGTPDNHHYFGKAIWVTLLMFLGEALCLPTLWIRNWYNKRKNGGYREADMEAQLLDDQYGAVESSNKPALWVFAILSLFDMTATALSSVAFKWVDASTTQMLRGSMVVFTAIFSVMLLRRRLTFLHWGGVMAVVLGLVLVALCSVFRPKDASDDVSTGLVILGVFLMLAGSAVNALQNVFEEKLMKGSGDVDPLEVVGWEGVFGTIFTSFAFLPIISAIPGDDCGKFEDTIDTLYMLNHSAPLVLLSIGYALSLYVMNFTLMEIAKVLSSIHRSLINSCRTVLVWVTQILMYYAFTGRSFGEALDIYSLLQLAGFFMLIAGTLIYGKASQKAAEAAAAQEKLFSENESHEQARMGNDIDVNDHSHIYPVLDPKAMEKKNVNGNVRR